MKKAFYCLSFLMMILLVFSCIFQIIRLTEETYLLHDNQQKLNRISEQNRSLLNGSDGASMYEIEKVARDMGFVDIDSISYIEIFKAEVVVR